MNHFDIVNSDRSFFSGALLINKVWQEDFKIIEKTVGNIMLILHMMADWKTMAKHNFFRSTDIKQMGRANACVTVLAAMNGCSHCTLHGHSNKCDTIQSF